MNAGYKAARPPAAMREANQTKYPVLYSVFMS